MGREVLLCICLAMGNRDEAAGTQQNCADSLGNYLI